MIVDNKFKDKIRKFYPIRAISAGKVAESEKKKIDYVLESTWADMNVTLLFA